MTASAPTTEQVRGAWDLLAADYDEAVTPHALRQGEQVLRRVPIPPGARFLDVAAGGGALGIPAARLGARVTATDLAPAMVERLTARARADGLGTLEAVVMDCHALDFADGTFDVVASQNGVTMSPRLDVALAEMARVARPGGTVLVVAFGAAPKAEFIALFVGALRAVLPDFPGLPTDPPPPPFQLADPDVFRGRLAATGLTDATVETMTWTTPVDSAAQLWRLATSSNPIAAQLVAGLPDARRSEAIEVLDGMLRERSGGQPGARLHAEMNVGTAIR